MTTDTPKPFAGPEAFFESLRPNFSNFISGFPVAMAIFDTEMRYIAHSQEWIDAFGLKGESLIGRCHYDVSPWLPESLRDAHRRVLAGETISNPESCTILPDGTETWQSWTIRPLHGVKGDVAGIVLITVDITERKQVERRLTKREGRLRTAMDAAGIGMFEQDEKTGDVFVSNNAKAMLNIAPETWSIEDVLPLLSDADRMLLDKAYQQAHDPSGDGRFAIEVHPTVEGVQKFIGLRGRVTFDKSDGFPVPSHSTGVVLDRTERHRLSQALTGAQRLETVGRMAGMIAHDFNNLLTVIIANLEFVDDGTALKDQTRSHLKRAIEAARMGSSFNRRLMALAGSRRPKPSVFAPAAHLADTWNIIERVMGENIDTRFKPGPRGAYVCMDQSELDGALLNLVVNAREAMTGKGRIEIACGTVELNAAQAAQIDGARAGAFCWVQVKDSGKGMTPETSHKAIEPFFTTKPGDLGTGLGLTSVATTVSRAGGFMDIASAMDEGTTITLYFPLVDPPERPHHADLGEDLRLGNGERVLVVEDDPMVRETVLERLEALGYAVAEASDADQALEVATAEAPIDLVFSDIVLPGGKSGYDLAEALEERGDAIPVLLTSGYMSQSLHPRTSRLSDFEVLQKPYSMAALAQAVAEKITDQAPKA